MKMKKIILYGACVVVIERLKCVSHRLTFMSRRVIEY